MSTTAQPAFAKASARQGVHAEANLKYVEEVNSRESGYGGFIGKITI